MGGVKEVAFFVDPGAEVHEFAVGGGDVFAGDVITNHGYDPAHVFFHIGGEDIGFDGGIHEVEGRAEGEAEEFKFIVGLFVSAFYHGGQLKVFGFGIKEGAVLHLFDGGTVDGIFFPHELVLVHAGEAEGADANEDFELLSADVYSVDKVFEAAEIAPGTTLFDDVVGSLLFELGNVDKTYVDVFAVDVGEVATLVDAGGVDIGTTHAGFVEVELGVVKAAKVVDHGGHKLKGVIGFEVEALERLDGKTRGVGFAEGVATEALHLPPYFHRQFIGVAPFFTISEKFFL